MIALSAPNANAGVQRSLNNRPFSWSVPLLTLGTRLGFAVAVQAVVAGVLMAADGLKARQICLGGAFGFWPDAGQIGSKKQPRRSRLYVRLRDPPEFTLSILHQSPTVADPLDLKFIARLHRQFLGGIIF